MNHLETFENWKRLQSFELLERNDLGLAARAKGIAIELVEGYLAELEGALDRAKAGEFYNKPDEALKFFRGLAAGVTIKTESGEILFVIRDRGLPISGLFKAPNTIYLECTKVCDALSLFVESLVECEPGSRVPKEQYYDDIVGILSTGAFDTNRIINVVSHEAVHFLDNKEYDIDNQLGRANKRLTAAFTQLYKSLHPDKEFDLDTMYSDPDFDRTPEFNTTRQTAYVNSNWEYNAFFLEGIADLMDDITGGLYVLPKTFRQFESDFLGRMEQGKDKAPGYITSDIVGHYTEDTKRRIQKRLYDFWEKLNGLMK